MPDSDSSKLIDKSPGSLLPHGTSSREGFAVQFWGVRGSLPIPGAGTVRYGGNTACVETIIDGQRLVFDGGTGIQALGRHLVNNSSRVQAHVFFTHTHWDRIQGFPFFSPAFVEGNRLDIYGAPAPTGASIKQSLTNQMLRPNFSTPLQSMAADMVFHNISAGTIIRLENGVTVETVTLNSSTSALGFRVSHKGYSLVYATDIQNSDNGIDQNLLYLAQDADLLIYSATPTEISHAALNGTVTVPWEMGVELAKQAHAKETVLFYHSPIHDDNYLERVEGEIKDRFPGIYLAREGMVKNLAPAEKTRK